MDKPTTTELLEWLGFVLGSASFGGKADAIRSILTEHEQVKEERDKLSLAIDQVVEHAEKDESRLALAEPLLKAAMEWDGRIVGESHMRLILALDAYRKAVEGANGNLKPKEPK
jgi:hypothetical protein